MTNKKINKHEEKLFNILCPLFKKPGQEVLREYKFDAKGTGEFYKDGRLKMRAWRFDFAIPILKLAFEVEGGTWNGGRHVHPIGYAKDCEKYNAATNQGWLVYRLVPSMINEDYIKSLLLL